MNKLEHLSRFVTAAALSALAFTAHADGPVHDAVPAAVVLSTSEVQPVAADAQRRLVLQGAHNVRTFANLRGSHGLIPANSFVRGDDLTRLTLADRDALARAGVTLDVDLRTAEEAADAPDALAGDARFKYVRISLMGTERLEVSRLPSTLGEMYVQSLAANKAQFREVFSTMATQKEGAVLFHCTAGKDRTGMIAATLLSLAGVPKQEITHNYAISAHYLKPMMSAVVSNPKYAALMQDPSRRKALSGSSPEDIGAFLTALEQQYGGAQGYLKDIGLSDKEVQSLRTRLGQSSH